MRMSAILALINSYLIGYLAKLNACTCRKTSNKRPPPSMTKHLDVDIEICETIPAISSYKKISLNSFSVLDIIALYPLQILELNLRSFM